MQFNALEPPHPEQRRTYGTDDWYFLSRSRQLNAATTSLWYPEAGKRLHELEQETRSWSEELPNDWSLRSKKGVGSISNVAYPVRFGMRERALRGIVQLNRQPSKSSQYGLYSYGVSQWDNFYTKYCDALDAPPVNPGSSPNSTESSNAIETAAAQLRAVDPTEINHHREDPKAGDRDPPKGAETWHQGRDHLPEGSETWHQGRENSPESAEAWHQGRENSPEEIDRRQIHGAKVDSGRGPEEGSRHDDHANGQTSSAHEEHGMGRLEAELDRQHQQLADAIQVDCLRLCLCLCLCLFLCVYFRSGF